MCILIVVYGHRINKNPKNYTYKIIKMQPNSCGINDKKNTTQKINE